ncbi:cupin domain-containing protein, partial [Ruminococcaceae bacterium OttesenSCG-928-D13]|nr:cupin domain-containing protein [Ruminococcaceae bacterium OttesenSCG-928-D13]
MRNAAQKVLAPVFWLGIFISFSSLLWLAIYANTDRADALSIGALVFLCALVQIAGFLGGRVFKSARFWPAACMLASAPATLWCAYIGPATLYGDSIDLLDFSGIDSKPPFYYFAMPVLSIGVLVCVAFVVVGLLFLAADIIEWVTLGEGLGRSPRKPLPPANTVPKEEPAGEPDAAAQAAAEPESEPPDAPDATTPAEAEPAAETEPVPEPEPAADADRPDDFMPEPSEGEELEQMIRKKSEQTITERPQMCGGEGVVQLRALLNGPEEMCDKGRLFSLITIPVGACIGFHQHAEDSETFYILSGTGEYDDNGAKTPVEPGDVLLLPAGQSHGMRNTGDVP